MIFLADSTLGMSGYNVLASQSRPMTAKEVHLVVTHAMQHDVDEDQMQRALDKLIELKRIQLDDDKYALVASESLIVVMRDRSDYDPDTGDGGWYGWRVKDPRIRDGQGTRPIEQLIGQRPNNKRIPNGQK